MLLFLDINNTFSTVRYRFFLLFLYLVFWQCYILYKLNRYYYQSSACELILFLNEHPCILLLCLLTKHLRLNLKYFMSVLLCPLRSLIACFTVWLLEKRAGCEYQSCHNKLEKVSAFSLFSSTYSTPGNRVSTALWNKMRYILF